MKVLSMAIAATFVLAFSTFAVAADNKKLLVGKWEAVKVDPDSLPVGTIVEFMADGKLKVTMKMDGKETTMDGTYTVDGDSFTYKMKIGDDEHSQKITIKKISETELDTADPDKKNASFKKVK